MSDRQSKARRRAERAEAERRASQDAARSHRWWTASMIGMVAVFGVLVVVVLRGNENGESTKGSAPASATAVDTSGLSPKLASNARDGNKVVDGTIAEKLAELRGVPVVVNQWASWCPNCRAEFGFFADLAKKYRGRVAFVGLDSQDDRGDAEEFLEEHPIPFPSIFDPSASEARSIGGGQGWPTTMFYNRKGERTHIRPGGYTTAGGLELDIQNFALAGRS